MTLDRHTARRARWHGVAASPGTSRTATTFTGKLHRLRNSRHPSGAGQVRRDYRAACGQTIRGALPATATAVEDLCGRCFPGHGQPVDPPPEPAQQWSEHPAYAAGAADERERLVWWLRAGLEGPAIVNTTPEYAKAVSELADVIESQPNLWADVPVHRGPAREPAKAEQP